MRRTRSTDGFTYIEVSIILLALAILVGIMLPNIGSFNSLARKVRLKEDLGVLCVSLKVMLDDLGDSAFFASGRTAVASYGGSFGAAGGYAASSTSRARVDSTTEYGVPVADEGEWCDNCNMPRSDCGPDCMDDCNEHCTARHQERYASVTTQTVQYESQASVGRGRAMAGSTRYTSSAGSSAFWGAPVGLLVGDGEIPASGIGATEWQLGLDSTFAATTHGYYPTPMTFVVDTFANLLIHQDPTYGRYQTSGAAGFGRGGGAYGMVDTTFRWRGPYIADRITADPWGNRYMANVFGLHAPISGGHGAGVYGAGTYNAGYVEGFQSAVVCYSAGQNETIETRFNQPYGWYTGGDDVTAVLAGAGGIR